MPDRWTDLGDFIRQQREMARLSLRRLSEIAGISNPYLSQIERGLRRPSAEILQKIAAGLRISGEALYIRAGILDAERVAGGDLITQILAAPDLDEAQRQILIRIYLSFRAENAGRAAGKDAGGTRGATGTEVDDTGAVDVGSAGAGAIGSRAIGSGAAGAGQFDHTPAS